MEKEKDKGSGRREFCGDCSTVSERTDAGRCGRCLAWVADRREAARRWVMRSE